MGYSSSNISQVYAHRHRLAQNFLSDQMWLLFASQDYCCVFLQVTGKGSVMSSNHNISLENMLRPLGYKEGRDQLQFGTVVPYFGIILFYGFGSRLKANSHFCSSAEREKSRQKCIGIIENNGVILRFT